MQKTITSDQIIFDEHIIVAKRKTPFDCAWNKFSLDAILTPVHSPVGINESDENIVSIIDNNDDLLDLNTMQLSMTMGGVKPSDAIKHDCMWTGQCNEHPQAKRYNVNCHGSTRRTIQPTSSRSLLKPQDFNYTCNAAIKISPNNSFADDGFIELWAHQIRPETPKSLTGDEAFDEKNLQELIDFIQNDKDNAMDIIEKLESENDYALSSSGEDMSDDCAFDPAKILNCMKFEVDDESNSVNSDMSDCYFGYDKIKTEPVDDDTTAITNSVILTTTENDHSYYATREHAERFNNLGVDTPSDSEEEEIDVVSLNPTHIPQQQLRPAVKTSPFMPTNPTIKERQKLQNKVATAISATRPAPIAVKAYNGRYITAAKALVKQELMEDDDDDDDDYLLDDDEDEEEEEVEEEEEEEYVVCKRGNNKRQPLRNKTNIQGRCNAQPQPSGSGRGRKRAATTQRGPQKGVKRGRGARGRRKREDMDSQDEDEKRSLHNVMERQRRIELRHQFDDLRLTIPSLVDKDRAAKVVILKEAKAMCDHLTVENERLEDQEDSLRRQQEQLETRLKTLRRWVYKNKVQLILNNINVDKLLQQ